MNKFKKLITVVGAEKLELNEKYNLENPETFKVGIVTKGCIELSTDTFKLNLKRGDTFFIPYTSKNLIFKGSGAIIFALPPSYK